VHIPTYIRGVFEEPIVDHLGNFFLSGKLTVKHVVINPVIAKQVGEASAVLPLDSITEFSQHCGRVHRASTILQNGVVVAAFIYGESCPSVNPQTPQYLSHGPCWEAANSALLCERVKQSLGLPEIERIKAFSEPALDRRKQIASFILLA